MGLVGGGAYPSLAVRFIIGVISRKPDGLAVPLEGQDMGGDAVQEPAVVADDHGAAGEV